MEFPILNSPRSPEGKPRIDVSLFLKEVQFFFQTIDNQIYRTEIPKNTKEHTCVENQPRYIGVN